MSDADDARRLTTELEIALSERSANKLGTHGRMRISTIRRGMEIRRLTAANGQSSNAKNDRPELPES